MAGATGSRYYPKLASSAVALCGFALATPATSGQTVRPLTETITVEGVIPALDERNPNWLPSIGPVGPKPPGREAGSWRLVEIDGEPVFKGQSVTFTHGKISGHDGCNSFGGEYRYQDEIVRFSQITSTLLGCAVLGETITRNGVVRSERPFPHPTMSWPHMMAATRMYFPEPDTMILSDDVNRRLAFERID